MMMLQIFQNVIMMQEIVANPIVTLTSAMIAYVSSRTTKKLKSGSVNVLGTLG